MKKTILVIAAAISVTSSAFSEVTINFGAGDFYQSANTSTIMPFGGRVNILSLNSGSWGNSTAIADLFTNLTDSYVPTGATLVAGLFSNDDAGAGTIGASIVYSYSGGFTAGDELLMVVYPTLTNTDLTPGFNTPGFFFRTASVIDGSDIAWLAPSDGSTVALYAYTLSQGGSLPNDQFTAGATATGGAGFSTVPEPSSALLLGLGAAGLYLLRRRKAKA